jgi:pimeloyl-ACP methyl ester carboxylesterase
MIIDKELSPLLPDAEPTAEEDLLAALDHSAERIETPCGNGRMVWRRWGAGPPLVLLHGGYGSWRHWAKTIPGLEGERTLYVPDLPSLGESDEAPAPGTPEAIAGIVGIGLDGLGIADDALDLVGFSFGSLVGGHIAAQRGPLRSLTLVGPGAFGLLRNNIELLKIEPAMGVAEQREIHRTNLGRLMIADPAKIDELAITIQQANVARARIKSRRFSKTDSLTTALRQAHPRRLNVIWGGKDVVTAPHFAERAELLRSLHPDVSVHIVPDAGHWVAYEAATTFNALLSRLLDRSASEASGFMR